MRIFLIILFVVGLIYGCDNSTKNQSIGLNSNEKNLMNNKTDKGESDYLEIKKQFEKDYYVDLNRRISQFYEYNKESSLLDSVKMIEEKLLKNRRNINHIRDSLSHLPLLDYIKGLNLPKLDSITAINYDIIEHSYTLDFNDYDKKIFKTDWEENWYLSRQLSDNFICIAICHFRDCENSIMLYSLNSKYMIIDSKELYDNGCYAEPAPDFKYKNYLVNEHGKFNASYFHTDTTFTQISRTYFSLRDTITNKVIIEIGDEYNMMFKIDSVGKFRVIENKSFKKEYVEPLYKVPI